MHNLTLAELNRATNKLTMPNVTRKDDDISEGFKDLTGTALGLFDMRQLVNYGESINYYYWLASPKQGNRGSVHYVYHEIKYIPSSYYYSHGIRPVITLSSSVKLVDTNNDGILEIQ